MSLPLLSTSSLLLATLAVTVATPQKDDPAPLRLKLLREMDARANEAAARAHIEARLLLDTAMPIAFLGMVAEPEGAELRVTQIYRESGAESVGLKVGDRLVTFAGKPLPTKAVLYSEIRRHLPGETVELRILREGKELVLRPVLGQRWEEDEEDEEQYGDISAQPFVSTGLPMKLEFDADPLDAPCPKLDQVLGGMGMPPRFLVVRDRDRVLLRQSVPDKTGIRFPIALVKSIDADDVVGRLRFHVVAGAQDRAAGIVLRYQDPANYLVARVNAVEGDLRIFRTVNGLRRTLPGAVAQISIDDDRWHVLEFRIEGPKVTAVLDETIAATSYDTYFPHGRVGLWTKSDSVTEFDDVSFSSPMR